MGRKILSLIIPVFLLIAIILVPLGKVKAQAIVIIAFAVIGIGEGERAEIYYSDSGSAPPASIPRDRVFFNYHHFVNATTTLPLPTPGEEACTETVQTTVKGGPGIRVLTLEMGEGNDSLLVNGEKVPLTETCFEDAQRVVLAIGRDVPPDMARRIAADPTTAQRVALSEVYGYSIVGTKNQETRAVDLTIPRGKPFFSQ